MTFTPRDPNFQARARAALADQPWAAHLGMAAGEVAPGLFEIKLPLQPFHLQHDGIVHGGVLATMADTAVALAALTLAAAGQRIVTIEFKINYLRPAQGHLLTCRGTVLRPGSSVTVAEAELWAEAGGEEKLVAKALATIAILPADGESAVRV